MRRGHIHLIRNPELVERLAGLAHDLKIRITPHHNRNQCLAHCTPLEKFFSTNHADARGSKKGNKSAESGSSAASKSLVKCHPERSRTIPTVATDSRLATRDSRHGTTSATPSPQYPSDNAPPQTKSSRKPHKPEPQQSANPQPGPSRPTRARLTYRTRHPAARSLHETHSRRRHLRPRPAHQCACPQ